MLLEDLWIGVVLILKHYRLSPSSSIGTGQQRNFQQQRKFKALSTNVAIPNPSSPKYHLTEWRGLDSLDVDQKDHETKAISEKFPPVWED